MELNRTKRKQTQMPEMLADEVELSQNCHACKMMAKMTDDGILRMPEGPTHQKEMLQVQIGKESRS